ncbi:ELOA1 protein, partial [Rhinopomastus cyanomelas]|nr:ELOA1 protein [Rhinopomastus cyanomelas]
MSFESYLTYDQVATRRKRKASSTGEQSKKEKKMLQTVREMNQKLPMKSLSKPMFIMLTQCSLGYAQAKVTYLQDLLNLPLPKFLTGLSISSPPYAADFEVKKPLSDGLFAASQASVIEESQQVSEMAHFTGHRLNSKMQVYSGSKTASLPKMLTLYEQCIRVLQNNIDSLHEVGGVPFEILEPVLTCCTPEQLLRIEEFNPTFTEETNYLWKKHCQRDFRNETLRECESWREMYLRLFNQREEKLKQLTKNILSAQSKKPKGRQVKMTCVTSTAKPPRNIHRQQEICGTAGPATQFHPT